MKSVLFWRWPMALLMTVALLGTSWAATPGDALMRAIMSNDAHAVRQQLAAGVNPNAKNEQGAPALYAALQEGALDAAQALLQSPQLDVNALNATGESALMMAAFKGQLAIAQQLLARGAKLNKDGWTPLHYAATNSHLEMMRYLMSQGANINARSPNGTTPLMMAARYGSPDAVRLLLQAHGDAQMRNDQGLSALDFALSAKRSDNAALLERQVDLGW